MYSSEHIWSTVQGIGPEIVVFNRCLTVHYSLVSGFMSVCRILFYIIGSKEKLKGCISFSFFKGFALTIKGGNIRVLFF